MAAYRSFERFIGSQSALAHNCDSFYGPGSFLCQFVHILAVLRILFLPGLVSSQELFFRRLSSAAVREVLHDLPAFQFGDSSSAVHLFDHCCIVLGRIFRDIGDIDSIG